MQPRNKFCRIARWLQPPVFLLLVGGSLLLQGCTSDGVVRRLNEYVSHFEPVIYDHVNIDEKHQRVKRSTEIALHLQFRSHNRLFHLRLKRDTSALMDNLVVEDHKGTPIQVDTDNMYTGEIVGESNSYVYGSIHDGVFQGRIESPHDREHYYIERAEYHRPLSENVGPNYHSLMYASSNVRMPHQDDDDVNPNGACGASDVNTKRWMDKIASSAVIGDTRSKRQEPQPKLMEDDEDFEGVYPSEDEPVVNSIKKRRSAARTSYGATQQQGGQQGGNSARYFYHEPPANKYTRTPHPSVPNNVNKRVCNLFVQTDTFLWEHIISTGKDNAKAREEISSLIAQHVEAASRIYKNTDFNGIKDIKFAVQRIRINDTSACMGNSRLTNPFCAANLDASNFLNLNSLANHDDFCLAYVWTFRDFQHGTLGLAWVASVNGASGGICEKYKTYSENNNGRSENVRRSLNTGIITFLNHNAKIPLKVSEITFAHEIGHNFGSPHDFPPRCVPGGHNGNYIMYASATQGHQPNNQKFSECSVSNISNVLHAIFKGEQKENCFQEYQGPFCGNKIVEANEECDCGYDERECAESCCLARDNSDRQKGCTRRPFASCSPSEGPCCNLRCEFENSGKPCRLETDCTELSFCLGNSAQCPPAVHKNNKTECNNGTQVCWNGECSGSICNKYGLEECFLTEDKTPDPDKLCEVACQEWDKSDTCRSTFEIEQMKHISGIKRRPGSPCNNFHGYCDVFQKCRNVDAEGPLARLKRLLFNKQSLHSVRQWVTLNWWAVLLMMVSLIITMACFIRCCAVHTPSSNPRMPPALRISDTLRRPTDTFKRRKRYVPPVEQNGPPPPYPGVVVAPSAPPGPSHGYGHGRGHYNRSQQARSSQGSTKGQPQGPAQQQPANPKKSSATRSNIEMTTSAPARNQRV